MNMPALAQDEEARLWLAVIRQAIDDATSRNADNSNMSQVSRRVIRDDARRWLTAANDNFEAVCGLAGLSPDQVRAHALSEIGLADLRIPSTDGRKRARGRTYEFRGERKTLREWGEALGFEQHVLATRIRSGWPIERALTQPQRTRVRAKAPPGAGRNFRERFGTGQLPLARD